MRTTMSNREHYATWLGILDRCNNPDSKKFSDYGGRGIVLQASFAKNYNTFSKYVDSLGEKRDGDSLDRIDVNGHYAEGNLRWADAKTQNNNKRNNSNVTQQREIRARKAVLRLSKRGRQV